MPVVQPYRFLARQGHYSSRPARPIAATSAPSRPCRREWADFGISRAGS